MNRLPRYPDRFPLAIASETFPFIEIVDIGDPTPDNLASLDAKVGTRSVHRIAPTIYVLFTGSNTKRTR